MLRNPKVGPPSRRLIALSLALLIAAGVAGPAAAAMADDGTNGISGAPSDGTSVDDRSRLSYQVDPGQHIDDFYLLKNTGTTAQTMKVFATDAFNTPNGAFGLLDTKSTPKDAGSWVTFASGASSDVVPLGPGESKVVSFRLAVPANASPGDHAGGIVVSVATPQGNIIVDRRIATRMYVRVKGALTAALTVGSIAATYDYALNPLGGSTTVKFTVRNNGNVALGANMVVQAKTWFGIGASGLVRTQVGEMLPGAARVVTTRVSGIAQLGLLTASVSLVPTVDRDALNPGPLKTTNRDINYFAMPWWLLIIVVVGGIVWLIARLRRRSDAKNAAAWIEHVEAEAARKSAEQPELVSVGSTAGSADGPTAEGSDARPPAAE